MTTGKEGVANPGTAGDVRSWDRYDPRTRRTFLWVLFLIGTSNYVDKNIVSVLLEQIKAEFGVSDTLLGVLTGISFALFYATFGIPVARWADRGDRKLIIAGSLTIWSAMTLLCGCAGSFWQLAMARFGVGAGEAGAMPPAQSLLADYYPPAQRASAIGILMMSSAAGYAIGLILGGVIAQYYGWRAAFIVVGLAGVLLAPLTYSILQEPRRAAWESTRGEAGETMAVTVRVLMAKAAYRDILAAIVVFFLMGYGALVFVVSLLIRLHGMSVARAGATFGVVSAIAAVMGNLAGGRIADRGAQRDITSVPRIAGWAILVAVPVFELALAAPGMALMLPLLLCSMAILNAALPPMFSALHLVCGSKRRAMAVAIALMLSNLIGVGLGPVITGALSDHLGVLYGPAVGLQRALMAVLVVLVPAGLLMLRAARHVELDAED